jgi:hypothetical protein
MRKKKNRNAESREKGKEDPNNFKDRAKGKKKKKI